MKINYKNTALGLLDDPRKFGFNLPDDDKGLTEMERKKFGRSVLQAFEKDADLFKKKIRYVSAPFREAFNENKHKLVDLFLKESISDCGTLIFSCNKTGFTNTIFYAIETNGAGDSEDWNYEVIYFQFSKYSKNDHISLDVCICETKEHHKRFLYKGFADDGVRDFQFISELIRLLVFLKYCDIDTKIIPGNRKDNHIGIKYVNETKRNIEILDSTWFTTLVKSEGFKVRGHFRWQPYGPGNSFKKLIWISGFEKDGYTRIAKVVTQNKDI